MSDEAQGSPTIRFYLKGGRTVDAYVPVEEIDDVVDKLNGPPRRVIFGDLFVYNHDVAAAELL